MLRKPTQDFFLLLVGGSLFVAGIFLFCNQVMVSSGMGAMGWGRRSGGWLGSSFGGMFSFGTGEGLGLLMIPLGAGVALLIAETYKKVGWFLIWASGAVIGVGILQSMFFGFRATSLWNLMTMVAMIGAGAGLMFKALRDYTFDDHQRRRTDSDDAALNYLKIKEELEELKSRLKNNPNKDD